MTLNELQAKTLQWSGDRGILANGKITTQALKLGSEMGELMDNAAKDDLEAIKDDIGDCLVVLTNLANLAGTTLEECWEVAYNDIKDRKGFLNANGNFIKSTDKNYKQLLMDFEGTKAEDPKCVNVKQINSFEYSLLFDDNTIEIISDRNFTGISKSVILKVLND